MYISASKGGVQKKFPLQIWGLMQQTGRHGWVIAPPEATAPEAPAKGEAMPGDTSRTAPVQKKKKASNEIPN